MLKTETVVWTIGHSTHSFEKFLSLVCAAGITAIADVRSSPYSRYLTHFNKDHFRERLSSFGIAYSFLGKELGGRPENNNFYCDGVADYDRMANSSNFQTGLKRVVEGAQRYRIALMCSEHDPLDCHRCLLVGRALVRTGVKIKHIASNGIIIDHSKIEDILLTLERQDSDDLFASREERLAIAYRKRARKVAYSNQAIDTINQMALN